MSKGHTVKDERWGGGCLRLALVAGLIGMVALGIVFGPSIARSREKRRAVACWSNMHSLALCTLQYAADWDQQLPPRPPRPFNRTLAEGVGVGTDLSKLCPPDDWRRQIHYINDQVFVCPSTRSIYGYMFNPGVYGARLSEMDHPAQTAMEYDAGFPTGTPPGPHENGYTVAYCDGHSKWSPCLKLTPGGIRMDGVTKQ